MYAILQRHTTDSARRLVSCDKAVRHNTRFCSRTAYTSGIFTGIVSDDTIIHCTTVVQLHTAASIKSGGVVLDYGIPNNAAYTYTAAMRSRVTTDDAVLYQNGSSISIFVHAATTGSSGCNIK